MRGSFAEQPRIPRLRTGVWLAALLCSLAGGPAAKGYVFSFTNANWPLGEIPFSLLLGSAGRTLKDGNTSWDRVATDATGLWNAELTPVRLTTAPGNGFASPSDKMNQVFWSSSVYGMSFDDALAVTLLWRSGNKLTEADIVVDQRFRWDSYRDSDANHVDPLQSDPRLRYTNDLQRVLVHEFGHALGLDHPDEAGQTVSSIMNSVIQNLNYLTADDIAGIEALFPPETTRPTVAIQSPSIGARVSQPDLTVLGTAKDNALADQVLYQLNGGTFQNAVTTNVASTINWSAMVSLKPASNTFCVKSVDTSTNESTVVSRSFFYVVSNAVTLQTNGAGVISPDLNGFGLEIGRGYTITALPSSGNVFSNWTGGLTSSLARLTFLMQSNLVLQANFVTNPFMPVAGTFTGLFRETTTARQESSGSFTLKLTGSGTYSGKLLVAGVSHSFSGRFDLDGRATNHMTRGTNSALGLDLTLDLGTNGLERITGTVSDGFWSADLLANRSVFNAATKPAPWAGLYTLIIPGTNDPAVGTGGDSYGTVRIDANGNVKLSGKLSDNTTLTQKAPLSKRGEWPVYVPLYSKKGSLFSWVQFDTNFPAAGLKGVLDWFKPTVTKGLYAVGFTNQSSLIGSSYLPPAAKTNRVVTLADGTIIMSGGNSSSTNFVTLTQDNKVTTTNAGLSLTFTLSSGLFKGSFIHPTTAKKTSFTGALLQTNNSGSGFFLESNDSGQVSLR
jgi:Matrixin/Divergent InlB B-repeat domain